MKNIVCFIVLMLFTSVAIGQRVNYSGEWKLNEDQSELGPEYSLAPASISIKHKRKTLDMKIVNIWEGQNLVSEQHFTLDGKECENVVFGESLTKSTAIIDKKTNALKIVSNGSVEAMDYTYTQNISLKDGQLVVNAEAASDMGELVETYVFDKQ